MLKIETVFIYSAPPSLKHSRVVAGQGKADGDLEGVFFPPVAELKEEIILLTSESCFLSLATQMNYLHMLLSENEFDQLV